MIFEGLRTFLLADATISNLIGVRAYSQKLPQDPTFPSIVITTISGQERYSTEGATGPPIGRFQIDSWDSTQAGSRTLAAAVRARLSGYKGAAGSESIKGAFIENDFDMYDYELNKYRRFQDYTINFTG